MGKGNLGVWLPPAAPSSESDGSGGARRDRIREQVTKLVHDQKADTRVLLIKVPCLSYPVSYGVPGQHRWFSRCEIGEVYIVKVRPELQRE